MPKTRQQLAARGRTTSNDNARNPAEESRNSRMALGDVSNRSGARASKTKEGDARRNENPAEDEAAPRRRSLRNKGATEATNDKPVLDQATGNELPKRRRPLRSCVLSQRPDNHEESAKQSKASAKKPKATQQAPMGRSTKRSREDETEKKQEAKKPKRSSSNAIGNKAGRDRERSAPRGSRKKQEPPRKPCAEFLTDSSYSLVPATTPFDSSKFTLGIAPHDQEKKDDVNEVSDYTTDIFQRLYHAEGEYRPKMYMDEQDEITPAMRAILVDWLVEVHMKFRLVPPTLYLCVNIIDRFCAKNNVERRKLQLVGVTALLVACKYEEIYPPEVRDCVYITDRAYTRQEVLDMEQDIVRSLEFKMTVPTAYPFLARFLHLTKASELTSFAANYYLERCLQEYDLLKYRPSLVAATAVCLALNNSDIRTEEGATGKFPGIPRKLLDYTGFDVTEMQECGTLMVKKIRNGETVTGYNRRNLVTVKQKFESRKYRHISDEYEGPTMDHMHG